MNPQWKSYDKIKWTRSLCSKHQLHTFLNFCNQIIGFCWPLAPAMILKLAKRMRLTVASLGFAPRHTWLDDILLWVSEQISFIFQVWFLLHTAALSELELIGKHRLQRVGIAWKTRRPKKYSHKNSCVLRLLNRGSVFSRVYELLTTTFSFFLDVWCAGEVSGAGAHTTASVILTFIMGSIEIAN